MSDAEQMIADWGDLDTVRQVQVTMLRRLGKTNAQISGILGVPEWALTDDFKRARHFLEVKEYILDPLRTEADLL